jgi:hypothetical protein
MLRHRPPPHPPRACPPEHCRYSPNDFATANGGLLSSANFQIADRTRTKHRRLPPQTPPCPVMRHPDVDHRPNHRRSHMSSTESPSLPPLRCEQIGRYLTGSREGIRRFPSADFMFPGSVSPAFEKTERSIRRIEDGPASEWPHSTSWPHLLNRAGRLFLEPLQRHPQPWVYPQACEELSHL